MSKPHRQYKLTEEREEEKTSIAVDLAGILGSYDERPGWAGAELCGVCELPQRGLGQSHGQKRILTYFEGHRMLPFVTTCIRQNLGGNLH